MSQLESAGRRKSSSYLRDHMECDFSDDEDEEVTLINSGNDQKSTSCETVKAADFSHVSIFSHPALSVKTLCQVLEKALKYL